MIYLSMLLVYLGLTAIMFVAVLAVWFAARRMPDSRRSLVLVVVATLLLTPSWGPATIVVVPVPFGIALLTTLMTWSWSELARWLGMFPLWHAIAFPATACVSYVVVRKQPSGKSETDGSAAV
jgi:hypothetical protein